MPGELSLMFGNNYETVRPPMYVQLRTLAAMGAGWGPAVGAQKMYEQCMAAPGRSKVQ